MGQLHNRSYTSVLINMFIFIALERGACLQNSSAIAPLRNRPPFLSPLNIFDRCRGEFNSVYLSQKYIIS